MTALAQNFTAYTGDAAIPVFTVVDQTGAPLDISTASDIRWNAARTTTSAAVLSKTKAAGQIAFVTDGTDGQFQVTILGTDTAVLAGVYLQQALIIDALGNQSTVALGQMTIGRAPVWTYDPTQLATSPLMQIRRLIGDVLPGDQQMYDDEIVYTNSQYNSVYSAAAECCRNLAFQFARKVDTVQGELKTNYSNQSKQYMLLSINLENRGFRGALPYAGGISNSDKQNVASNPDRVPPSFNREQFDDLLLGDTGNQTPTPAAPDTGGFD